MKVTAREVEAALENLTQAQSEYLEHRSSGPGRDERAASRLMSNWQSARDSYARTASRFLVQEQTGERGADLRGAGLARLPYESEVRPIPAGPDGQPATEVEVRTYADGSWSSHLTAHEHEFEGQVLRHSHAGGDLPHGYYGHREDAPPIGDPEHPACGRCGVRRDRHDDERAGHAWQWNRPAPPPPDWQRAVGLLRKRGRPHTAAQVCLALGWALEQAQAALAKGIDQRAVWTNPHDSEAAVGWSDPLFWAVSRATPGCESCGRPLVFAEGSTAQYHEPVCRERDNLGRSLWQ